MSYNPEWYQRKKLGLVKKSEDFDAFREIRERWGFDDIKIRQLLLEYTKTEILFGNIDKGVFRPKELINLKGFLIILTIVLGFIIHSNLNAKPEYKLVISPETITQP